MTRHLSWLLAALTLALLLAAPGAGRAEEPQDKLGTIKSVKGGVITATYNDDKSDWKVKPPAGAAWKIYIDGKESSLDDLKAALAKVKPRTVKFSNVKNLGSNTASTTRIEAFTK
jgi:hypothetical protein